MRRVLFSASGVIGALVSGFLAVSSQSPARAASVDEVRSLYGEGIEFGIYRNGSPIGRHSVSFAAEEDGLRVNTDFDLKVGALFVTLYRLDYASEALWRDGKLVALTARTDQNGDVAEVEARAEGDAILVEGPNGPYEAPLTVYPTNHWNAGVIGTDKVINTITGRVADVRSSAKKVQIFSRAVTTTITAGLVAGFTTPQVCEPHKGNP